MPSGSQWLNLKKKKKPFYRWENWGPETWRDLHKITQLISNRARTSFDTSLVLPELILGQNHAQGVPILKLYMNLQRINIRTHVINEKPNISDDKRIFRLAQTKITLIINQSKALFKRSKMTFVFRSVFWAFLENI